MYYRERKVDVLKLRATCVSSEQRWLRGKQKVMESHLALRCEKFLIMLVICRGNLHFCVDNIVKEALKALKK
ncbi:5620_t:CDS:2 [Scutellospora calospora]|uniref:5620_t:CDS:1 n=1 Tax=Scutellospora calospora TaxID=85575 RepID=A0ACA9KFD9_9GLOM|nr:5620_t:CDS:2 [Scutellospora calospora]